MTDVVAGKDGNGTYISSITGDAETGYIITNTHTPVKTLEPDPDPVPKPEPTSDPTLDPASDPAMAT